MGVSTPKKGVGKKKGFANHARNMMLFIFSFFTQTCWSTELCSYFLISWISANPGRILEIKWPENEEGPKSKRSFKQEVVGPTQIL